MATPFQERLAQTQPVESAQAEALRRGMNQNTRPVLSGTAQPTLADRMATNTMPQQSQQMRANGFNGGTNVAPMKALALSVPTRLGANAVDSGSVGAFANDFVNNGDYKHPELKAGLQSMFPRPKGYKKGGLVDDTVQYTQSAPDFLGYDQTGNKEFSDPDPLIYNPQSKDTDKLESALREQTQVKQQMLGQGIREWEDLTQDEKNEARLKKGGIVKPTNKAMTLKPGKIKGPGTPTSDSIKTNLQVGAAIIPAHRVEELGIDFLNKLRSLVPK